MKHDPVLIARSPRMQQVLRQVERLGRYRWPVLLLGETGTGKEVIARALHEVNPVGPFVTIDCSALVGSLVESELFGHARGAFTGAVEKKMGLIEQAHGGTAFFDEIGELPLDLQAKLLRLLQEKEFRPVGAMGTRRAEFRVIAATNRDLKREMAKGRFRSDLFYRLNVVSLRLPPLRERPEDIEILVDHFLRKYGRDHEISTDTMEALRGYPWPGNVRELENCVKHMVSANSGPCLHNADLPSAILNHVWAGEVTSLASESEQMLLRPLFDDRMSAMPPAIAGQNRTVREVIPLSEVERRAILDALAYTKGDRLMAARLLGIGRTTLYRKIKEYNVAV